MVQRLLRPTRELSDAHIHCHPQRSHQRRVSASIVLVTDSESLVPSRHAVSFARVVARSVLSREAAAWHFWGGVTDDKSFGDTPTVQPAGIENERETRHER